MRSGFTTGSCAAAAAGAATYMLLSQQKKEKIKITTPAGTSYEPDILDIDLNSDYVSCAVKKDAGDDPDITNGILVYAKVEKVTCQDEQIQIIGGTGVGKITRPGLEMPVGEYAINSTPRKMIKLEVQGILDSFDVDTQLLVTIYVPDGEQIAQKTFNPHMGIVGGISILGTTGIVEPMSSEALIKTIELDLSQKYAEGAEVAVMVPGNYGVTFLKNNYEYDEKKAVLFSNYVGVGIDKAIEVGFKKILIVGHTGKLVKVAGGIMNTHSKEADSRMELMVAAILKAAKKNNMDIEVSLLNNILDQVTTTAALDILKEYSLVDVVCEQLLDDILYHLQKRAGDECQVEAILYENSYGLLAKSTYAEEFL